MCGVCGIRRFDGRAVPNALLRTMTERLHHRGPDEDGYWFGEAVGLGHRRLSIIDLAGSSQPMRSGDGRYAIVFNGEIFNYRSLRGGLGYPFVTNGDTEVLMAGLILRGSRFLTEVRGQFAFCLYDSVTGTVTLGRDHAGVIPLYYFHNEHFFAFASEIKSLLPAVPSVEVDQASIDDYLTRNAVPAPHTLFKGVRKVLPGHTLRLEASGSVSTSPFWHPPVSDPGLRSPSIAVAEVRDGLRAAVSSALVADVPVGAYLSGGLDSSLITALIRESAPGSTIETFSAGFGDPRYDELPWARRVADQLGTQHHVVTVRPNDFIDLWPSLTWYRDAPLSQPADIAVFRLAELARQHVKVVLSGEGSDELFAGYNKYRFVRAVEATNVVPPSVRDWSYARLGHKVPRNFEIVMRAAAAGDPQARRESWFAPFRPAERVTLLGKDLSSRRTPWEFRGDAIRRQLEHDFRTWLPDNLLERGDRMSMAASLELRPPFLNQDLIDLAFRLPSKVKVRHGQSKWIIKEVGRFYLPDDLVRRPKVGFRVPLDTWFRHGLRDMARDLLLAPDSLAQATFASSEIRGLLDRHDMEAGNEEHRLWTLLSLEVWYRQFFPSHPGI